MYFVHQIFIQLQFVLSKYDVRHLCICLKSIGTPWMCYRIHHTLTQAQNWSVTHEVSKVIPEEHLTYREVSNPNSGSELSCSAFNPAKELFSI